MLQNALPGLVERYQQIRVVDCSECSTFIGWKIPINQSSQTAEISIAYLTRFISYAKVALKNCSLDNVQPRYLPI